MQVSRAEESMLLLPSVETRTVVSAVRGILPEVGRMCSSNLWAKVVSVCA